MDISALLIGGVIGGCTSYFVQFLLTSLSNIKSIKNPYKGIYYSYHFSTSGNGNITEHQWEIYRRISGKVGVKLVELDHEAPLRYKGTLKVKGRNLYFYLDAVNHEEGMFAIFPEPIDQRILLVTGVLSAVCINAKPWSGIELLSKERMNFSEARTFLESSVASEP